MSSPDPSLPLIVIVGPTAVGKTGVSIQLAERLDGEIVSADSRLFYRGMDIGTAKPTPAERARVPHHLIDVADPRQSWSLAVFQAAASKVIAEIHSRHHLPFLVGGTGQYVHAVTHAWSPPPAPPDPRLRRELESHAAEVGYQAVHDELRSLDPVAAAKIDPRNLRRTLRALEVIRLTGRKFSEQSRQTVSPYRLYILGLTRPRPELYARIDARIDDMFAAGFIDEVQNLIDSGCSPDLPTLSAIGYRQAVSVLSGDISVEQAKTEMRRQTRIFVRRQANWFKLNDPAVHWFDPGITSLDEMLSSITVFLRGGN